MPTYDYRCDHCGHTFSRVQSFQDEALEACPSCGKRPRRLIAASGIVFKGSGWYKTDSRASRTSSAGGKGDKGGEANGDRGAEAKDDKGGDAKKKSGTSEKSDAAPPSTTKANDAGPSASGGASSSGSGSGGTGS